MSLDIEEQYDNIYRYCYFKLHNRELTEDLTLPMPKGRGFTARLVKPL